MIDRIHARCNFCGATIKPANPFGDRCRLCFDMNLHFGKATAIGNYQGMLQDLVIQMKGQRDEALALQLGRLLGFQFLQTGNTDFDLVASVPSFWLKRLRSGFHAADVIREGFCKVTGMKEAVGLVKATRSTRKQGTLSRHARLLNVRNAFRVHWRTQLTGKRILIIDDVMTSGATTSEIARIMREEGVGEVQVAVVARGARGN